MPLSCPFPLQMLYQGALGKRCCPKGSGTGCWVLLGSHCQHGFALSLLSHEFCDSLVSKLLCLCAVWRIEWLNDTVTTVSLVHTPLPFPWEAQHCEESSHEEKGWMCYREGSINAFPGEHRRTCPSRSLEILSCRVRRTRGRKSKHNNSKGTYCCSVLGKPLSPQLGSTGLVGSELVQRCLWQSTASFHRVFRTVPAHCLSPWPRS